MKIIITGFEPFGSDTVNPSYEAVKMLPDTIDDCEIIKVQLPVEYRHSGEILEGLIEKEMPDAVICVGQAGGYARITLEYVAVNIMDASIPDNAGYKADGEPVIKDAPNAYFTSLPVKQMASALMKTGLPASISYSAGTYVCNSTMYQLLHLINTKYPSIRGGFIHIPFDSVQVFARPQSTPYLPLRCASEGLCVCIKELITV